jgi:hypothetical protein
METLRMSSARLRKVVSVGVWTLYTLSLVTPVVNDRGGAANYHVGFVFGFLALGLGWIPPSTLPWSANLLLVIGWVFFWRKRYFAALCLAILAALAGFTAPWLSDPSMGRLQMGYYLWQCSLLLFSWGAFAMLRIEPELLSGSRKKTAGEPLAE